MGLDHSEHIKHYVSICFYHHVPASLLSMLCVCPHLTFITSLWVGTTLIPMLQTRKLRYRHDLKLDSRAPGSNSYYQWYITLYVSLLICTTISLGYIPRNGIAWFKSSFKVWPLIHEHIIFQRVCSSLQSHIIYNSYVFLVNYSLYC